MKREIWQQHGKSVPHCPRHPNLEALGLPTQITVYSRADAYLAGHVSLSVYRDPFSVALLLEPDDAEALADNLRAAAEAARAIRGAAPKAAA